MIELSNITHYYRSQSLNPVLAIDHLSFTINDQDFIAIVGRSGSGKSTLMHIISGLLKPTEGEVKIDGQAIYELSSNHLADFRNRTVGFIFQNFYLDHSLSAIDNVILPILIRDNISYKQAKVLGEKVLEEVGLKDRMHHKPGQLSGGECQRVSIARALVTDPKIIFADEPTGNLDKKTGESIIQLLHQLNEQGRIIILVTHNEQDAKVCHKIIELEDGKIKQVTENEKKSD